MTKDELLKTYSIGAVVQMATMTGIIKVVREVGKDFSERAIEAVLAKMYPELNMFNLDEVLKIGDSVRETLGIQPMTFTKQELHEVREALAAATSRPALPLSRRIHRMMSTETHDGWVSIGGTKYAVTPSIGTVDFDGDTDFCIFAPTEAK